MNSVLTSLTQGAYKLAVQLLSEPADAHDVLQDAAAIAISHKRAPNPHSKEFKPWFFRVVRNKAIDRLRQLKRHNHDEFDETSFLNIHNSQPEAYRESEQLQQKVHRALNCLSIKQREIILLKDYHDCSYQDIAEILGIPKGSVMSQLHRSRLALKKLLRAE